MRSAFWKQKAMAEPLQNSAGETAATSRLLVKQHPNNFDRVLANMPHSGRFTPLRGRFACLKGNEQAISGISPSNGSIAAPHLPVCAAIHRNAPHRVTSPPLVNCTFWDPDPQARGARTALKIVPPVSTSAGLTFGYLDGGSSLLCPKSRNLRLLLCELVRAN